MAHPTSQQPNLQPTLPGCPLFWTRTNHQTTLKAASTGCRKEEQETAGLPGGRWSSPFQSEATVYGSQPQNCSVVGSNYILLWGPQDRGCSNSLLSPDCDLRRHNSPSSLVYTIHSHTSMSTCITMSMSSTSFAWNIRHHPWILKPGELWL